MAIKIMLGGSPCTHWSIAQKNNRETEPKGMGWELFKNYLIAKEKFKPDFFLYENNKSAAQAIKDQIAYEFGVGVDPDVRFTHLNSALVSAQNRQRFYVTNFGEIETPEDRGILLKDILECGTIDKEKAYCLKHQAGNTRDYFKKHHTQVACEPVYIGSVPDNNGTYLNGKQPSQQYRIYDTNAKGVAVTTAAITNVAEPVRIPEYGSEKARPLNAYYSNNCGGFEHRMFSENPNKQQVDMIAESVKVGSMPGADGELSSSQSAQIYSINGKSTTQCANGGGMGAKTGLYAIPVNTSYNGDKSHTLKAQYYKNGVANFITNDGFDATAVAEPVNVTKDGKSQTIKAQYQQTSPANILGYTSTYGASGVAEPIGFAIPVEWDENGRPTKAVSGADGKTYTVYEVEDGIITIKEKEYPIKLEDGFYIIRKLTVTECCRLQTMPDDYCKAVSDSQAYKGLGNGWTAEIIIHLLNHALKDVPRDEELVVLSLYDGIGTGRYCLDKMGFTNVKYYAYEIDKYPIMISMDNYPDIIQCGDAFAVREDDWKPPQTQREWLNELLGGV